MRLEFIPTPNGHKYWVPKVPDNEKRKKGDIFVTFDYAHDEYDEAGDSVELDEDDQSHESGDF